MESAVYSWMPASGDSAKCRDALVMLGAEAVDAEHLILREAGHWIDVQIDVPAPSVSLRLAFCNPEPALAALRAAFEALEGAGPGELVDVATRERFPSIDDATWARVVSTFEERRQEFRSHFGEFTAAISAEEVFEYVRAQRERQ